MTLAKRKPAHGKTRTGTVTLVATCSQSAVGTLKGTVTEHPRHRKAKTFRLSTIHAALRAGASKQLKMRIAAPLILALKHGLKESAAFTLIAGDVTARAHTPRLRI